MNKDTIKQYLDFTKDNLRSKKNIFLISLLTTISITFISSTLNDVGNLLTIYRNSFITVFGISSVIALMLDFSFVFSKEEINYYLGKPTTLYSITMKKIFANLTYVFLLSLSMIPIFVIAEYVALARFGSLWNFYLTYIYSIMILYSAIVIGFLISSSLISGILASIVVYFLPLIVLSILDTYTLTITSKIYGSSYDITRFEGFDKSMDYFYRGEVFGKSITHPLHILNMIFVALVLYFIIRVITKKRNNEINNSGIVFYGLQNFLTVSLCVMFAGNVYSTFNYENTHINYLSKAIVYILIFFLVHFVATIILNKSLKVTKRMIFQATSSLLVVLLLCFGIYGFSTLSLIKLPKANKIAYVEVMSDEGTDYGNGIHGGVVLTEEEDIQKIIDLNEKILISKYQQPNGRIIFKYVYKGENPKIVYRSFQKARFHTGTIDDSKNLNYHLELGDFREEVSEIINDESIIEAILDNLVIDYDSETYSFQTNYLYLRSQLNYEVDFNKELNEIFRAEVKTYIKENGNFYDITSGISTGNTIFGEIRVDSTRLKIRFKTGQKYYFRLFRLVDGYFDKTIKYIEDNSPRK